MSSPYNDRGSNASECGGAAAKKKMFFTTSDLIERMNSSIKESVGENGGIGDGGGFELQRKMPDGSYRRAEKSEMAAADFQAKLKQAAERISSLSSQEKIEWANHQRQEGNNLFANGDYKEAMDVYLTCLVAMEPGKSSNEISLDDTSKETPSPTPDEAQLKLKTEKEIQLPVLLNLSLCAMKMGTLSKAHKFCNFAMDLECGKTSVKAHYRRGKVRMLMGEYIGAELDFEKALDLLDNPCDNEENGHHFELAENADKENRVDGVFQKSKTVPDVYKTTKNKPVSNEREVILREKQKLHKLINQAEKNRKHQKMAMERVFSGTNSKTDGNGTSALSLYPEKAGSKSFLTRKDDMPSGNTNQPPSATLEKDELDDCTPSYFEWYMRMIGRCAQKLLDVIGEDDEGENYFKQQEQYSKVKIQ